MRTAKFTITLVFISFVSVGLFGQELTKQEKRALKKELKELERNPERFQKMKEEVEFLDRQMEDKESLITDQSFVVDELDRQIKSKDQEIDILRKEFSDLSNQLTSSGFNTFSRPDSTTTQLTTTKEVYFSVQIGAYKNLKIIETLQDNNYANFTVEEDNSSGYKKFLIGKFDSYKEAKNLTKVLKKSGAQCFVVAYKNNNRIPHLKQLDAKYF